MSTVIEIKNLSKLYSLGVVGARTFQDDIRNFWLKKGMEEMLGGEKEKDSQSSSVQPVPSLLEVLSDTWTADKTKKFLSEGFIANLSFGLISGGEAKTQPNQEALKEPLKGIRKVLADECMVEDDVTDLMLLDLVMNALGDRIEIYKLQAENRKLEDIDLILDLRYKADRRLIETLLALKNS